MSEGKSLLIRVLLIGIIAIAIFAHFHNRAQDSERPPTTAATQSSPSTSALRGGESQLSQASAPPNVPQSSGLNSSPRITPAEKFALDLERQYQQNGFDIDVSAFDHELRLRSDLLQDAALRDSLVSALRKDEHTLCGLEIWYLKVGYSKGWFSSDIMKSATLNCPAAKAARLQQNKVLRDELAAQLNSPEVGLTIHADGTTLTCESNFFSEPSNRERTLQVILLNRQALCDRGFTLIAFLKNGKTLKTVPIRCQ